MTIRYWVTGVSSFVGAALAHHWAKQGHSVFGIHSQPKESYSGIRAERLADLVVAGVHLDCVDLGNSSSLVKSIQNVGPDVAVHHAGWVDRYAGWEYDFEKGQSINVAPLSPLCETLQKVGSKGLIVTGSSAEYVDHEGPHDESENGTPPLPYGLSKLTETRRAEQLSAYYNLRVRVGRLFIPFGSGDTPAKVLPSVADALNRKASIDLSPCEQRRDFVFIEDVLDAYDRMVGDLARPELFDIFNISSGHATRLRDVLEALAECWGANKNLLRFGVRPLRSGEPIECYGSNKKAGECLGWHPGSWQEGVRSYAQALLGRTVR